MKPDPELAQRANARAREALQSWHVVCRGCGREGDLAERAFWLRQHPEAEPGTTFQVGACPHCSEWKRPLMLRWVAAGLVTLISPPAPSR